MITSTDFNGHQRVLKFKGGAAVERGAILPNGGKVEGGVAPHKPGSSGKVWVTNMGCSFTAEYFAHVHGMEWAEVREAELDAVEMEDGIKGFTA